MQISSRTIFQQQFSSLKQTERQQSTTYSTETTHKDTVTGAR